LKRSGGGQANRSKKEMAPVRGGAPGPVEVVFQGAQKHRQIRRICSPKTPIRVSPCRMSLDRTSHQVRLSHDCGMVLARLGCRNLWHPATEIPSDYTPLAWPYCNWLAATAGGAAMTDRSYEIPQDADLRNLARVVSACTLGLWAFAAGLLIGVFLFS
jgi:hypothetical protein